MLGLIRSAGPDQATILTELAQRAKAHWGYSNEFMQAVKKELTYTAESMVAHPTQVLTHQGRVLGFYQLQEVAVKAVELEALFVDPDHLRQGWGAQLFHHAVVLSRGLGYEMMVIQSDPQAAAFYASMGCVQVGEAESLSIPGRWLPMFQLRL